MKSFKEYQEELKRNIEHAPEAILNIHATHQGFWLPVEGGDLYICAECAGRILARGISLPNGVPCYKDEPRGVCAVSEGGNTPRTFQGYQFPYTYMGKLTKNTYAL